MALSKKCEKLIDEFAALSKSKGYDKKDGELLIMIACSDQIKEVTNGLEGALQQLINFCKERDDATDCIDDMLSLVGC